MSDSYTIQLAREYVRLVQDMRSGLYSQSEVHQMDVDRQWTHRELCRLTGHDLDIDMYQHALDIVYRARMENLQ